MARVDPSMVVEPQSCPVCQGNHWESKCESTRSYVVAQLVERPIEIVEYQLKARVCHHCGTLVGGELQDFVIPGQDKKRVPCSECWRK
ncbi:MULTISPECIES: hypothetical protein [unclassified Moorena]|uniref:hypothetical protein n=1 Tax=unclassified Moorena TaxID=2683338 RepID=UPI0013FA9E22|nr:MULTISPECIES: hypothetical protein [unclassified Moorena]NEO82024.1 hypothetical protein [Moorena sp. SIO4G3]NEP21555.1 hypothetical protein [Moorena sp. SIO3I6]